MRKQSKISKNSQKYRKTVKLIENPVKSHQKYWITSKNGKECRKTVKNVKIDKKRSKI